MPAMNNATRRRFFRAPKTIRPIVQIRKPVWNHSRRELRSRLQLPASPLSQDEANDVAEVSEIAAIAAIAKPLAQSGTTQLRFVSRQSSQVCATTKPTTTNTNSATPPPKLPRCTAYDAFCDSNFS
jgi:hypothetical protein